jgi:N-methylhydantoinase A
VLCALGLAAAAPRHDVSRTVMLRGEELTRERLRRALEELIAEADAALAGERASLRVAYELRYVGQSFELSVETPAPDPEALREAFAAAHEQRYGHRDDDAPIELVNMRVSAWGPAPRLRPRADATAEPERSTAEVVFGGEALAASVLRGELTPGTDLHGPMLCALPEATLLVPPRWSGAVDEHGTCVLEDATRQGRGRDVERASNAGLDA